MYIPEELETAQDYVLPAGCKDVMYFSNKYQDIEQLFGIDIDAVASKFTVFKNQIGWNYVVFTNAD